MCHVVGGVDRPQGLLFEICDLQRPGRLRGLFGVEFRLRQLHLSIALREEFPNPERDQ